MFLLRADIINVGAALASGAEVTDVVHPDVPGGAIAPEGVSQAARFRVPLQDEDSFTGGTRQQSGSRQASDARTDHDDVVGYPYPSHTRQCQVSIAVNWTLSSSAVLDFCHDL